MIRKLLLSDSNAILKVVNDAAQAYKNVIPSDRWKDPYMPSEELKKEIETGIEFYGWKENDTPTGSNGNSTFRRHYID